MEISIGNNPKEGDIIAGSKFLAFGEKIRIFFTTFSTISALIPMSYSLVIPGFLGTPEVTTTTSLFDVLE